MNEFNQRTAMNYHLRTGLDAQLQQDAKATRKQRRMAKRRITVRQLTAAIRHRNKLIALDMALIGVICAALGVLIGCAI